MELPSDFWQTSYNNDRGILFLRYGIKKLNDKEVYAIRGHMK